MARLLRPYIPIPIRLKVIERQITRAGKCTVVFDGESHRRQLCGMIRFLFGDALVHLDHDPSLAAREKIFRLGKHVGYRPDANDADHLIYREAVAHRLKTNVRGEHGQHPDRVLIKKTRRAERASDPAAKVRHPKRKQKIQSRGFDNVSRPFQKRKPHGRTSK